MPGQQPTGSGVVLQRSPIEEYDSLPDIVKRALRDSLYDWETSLIVRALAAGASPESIVEGIRREDEKKRDIDRSEVWNIDPEGTSGQNGAK